MWKPVGPRTTSVWCHDLRVFENETVEEVSGRGRVLTDCGEKWLVAMVGVWWGRGAGRLPKIKPHLNYAFKDETKCGAENGGSRYDGDLLWAHEGMK